jgi:hypothetical protein
MHATNAFPVDRHPQYRDYPTTIRSIASGIIIEVKKIHIIAHCSHTLVKFRSPVFFSIGIRAGTLR